MMLAIIVMWAFGVMAAPFPLIGCFDPACAIKGRGGVSPAIDRPYAHAPGAGLAISIALIVLLARMLEGETGFAFVAMSRCVAGY